MKKTIFTLFITLIITISCNAQMIKTEKVFGGYKFTENDQLLTQNDLTAKLKSNSEAFSLLKKAKSSGSIGLVLSAIGGGLVGWPLGTAIGGGDPEWVIAGVGAGCIAIGIPIAFGADKKVKRAVDIYNAGLSSSILYKQKPEYKIVSNGQGIGLSIAF